MKDLTSHIDGLRRYARYLTRDPDSAEDLVQECLVAALAGAHTLRPGAPLRPWLFRIMYTCHAADWRRRARAPLDDGRDADGTVAASQQTMIELSETLRALDALPEAQRDALALVALEDMSYAQAAQVLGIPLGTLMSRLARARTSLRQMSEHGTTTRLRAIRGKTA